MLRWGMRLSRAVQRGVVLGGLLLILLPPLHAGAQPLYRPRPGPPCLPSAARLSDARPVAVVAALLMSPLTPPLLWPTIALIATALPQPDAGGCVLAADHR